MAKTIPLLVSVAITGAGTPTRINDGANPKIAETVSYVASVIGTGAVSATVVVEVSNDGADWAPRMTFTLSGTDTAFDCGVDADGEAFKLYRGNVTAISGTGAKVKLIGYGI